MTVHPTHCGWIGNRPLLALLGALAVASPGQAQSGGARPSAPPDTVGAGGAPRLRSLVASSRRDSDLRVVRQRFDADRAALDRRYDIPLSPVLHVRLRAFYDGWSRRLQELNANELNAAGRADLAELRKRIRAGLDTVAVEEQHFAELMPLLSFARAIQVLQERRRDRLDVDPVAAAQTLTDVLKDVKRLSAAIDTGAGGARPAELRGVTTDVAARAVRFLGAMPATDSAAARAGFGAPPAAPTLRATLDSWYSFYFGYDPLFTWWVRKPYEELVAALEAYSRAIQRAWAVATE
jgi:hypothetical protein